MRAGLLGVGVVCKKVESGIDLDGRQAGAAGVVAIGVGCGSKFDTSDIRYGSG